MSIIIGVGQCGCSVADAALEKLDAHLYPHDDGADGGGGGGDDDDMFGLGFFGGGRGDTAFFREAAPSSNSPVRRHPRCVLVDTEAKAVEDNLRARRREGRARPRSGSGAAAAVPVGRWAYDERGGNATVVLGQGGAGTNWAHGYSLLGGMTESEEEGVRDAAAAADGGGSGGGGSGGGLGSVSGDGGASAGNAMAEQVLGAVRREAERMDSYFTPRRGFGSGHVVAGGGRLDSIVVCSSAAGGTGSGLGAALTEDLRDAFPRVGLLNAVVCPYHVGEVIVQNYNACLSFAHLSLVSDAV